MTSFLPQTKKTSEQSELCSDVVREAGVEPARPCEHWHLKPASLPIPPLAHLANLSAPLSARFILPCDSSFVNTFFTLDKKVFPAYNI